MGLRDRLQEEEILQAIGCYDAVSATVAEREGAEALYMSGSSVSSSITGEPDVGLATMTEMAQRAHQITGAVDVPLLADADTGYGNPINVRRTVREYERAGVQAIHIEDQTFPKQCGHFEGKTVMPVDKFEQKIRAAADATEKERTMIIARTDALAVEGIESAIDRANRYRDCGADILFVEAPESREQMERIVEEAPGTHLANMATGGNTPMFSANELDAIGYDVVIYASELFRGAMKTYERLTRRILEDGTTDAIVDDIVSWEKRNEINGLDRIRELEEQYSVE